MLSQSGATEANRRRFAPSWLITTELTFTLRIYFPREYSRPIGVRTNLELAVDPVHLALVSAVSSHSNTGKMAYCTRLDQGTGSLLKGQVVVSVEVAETYLALFIVYLTPVIVTGDGSFLSGTLASEGLMGCS